MSAEDAILYRQIGGEWWVMGVGTTYEDAELSDEAFAAKSTKVDEANLAETLYRLDAENVTEFRICYAGEYVSDPPASVPASHRILCCFPDEYRKERRSDGMA